MRELLARLSIRRRKNASPTTVLHNSNPQGTRSPSPSDPASPLTPHNVGGNDASTLSPVAMKIPETLPMPLPSYAQGKTVNGLLVNNREQDRGIEANFQYLAGAATMNNNTEDSGINNTLAKIGDHAAPIKAVVSTAVDLAGGTDVIKQNMSSFVEKSAVVISALDEVAKLHPFIGVVVMAFKAAWTLEKTRRENNQKIIALHLEIKDMMEVLVQLKDVRDPDHIGVDGSTVRGRMQQLADDTAKDIKECANVCDAYSKRKLIVKVLNGAIWEARLAEYGGRFTQRRTDFQFVLSMHTAVGVDTANRILGHVKDTTLMIEEKVDMMMKMFQDLMSPEERELTKVVNQKGGRNAIMENEKLLRELSKRELEGGGSTTKTGTKAGGKPYSFENLRDDLRAGPEKAIQKNMAVFSRKLEMQQNRIAEEMKAAVKKEGDRIIEAIETGPHDRINDPDIRILWKEMGWRGSIKVRYFVMGLRDFYHEKWGSEVQAAGDDAHPSFSSNSDEWALAYLNVQRLQPIGESFDDDASGFITVAEVNTFTTARPLDWSLPHWIAFWAIGWHQSLAYSAGRIRGIFAKMFAILPYIHPSNQGSVNKYLSEVYQDVTTVEAAINPCYINETLQAKFQVYVESEEIRLRKNLETVCYDIDAMDTLALITGSGRIGKFAHTLLYLLLERHFEIFRICQHYIIHPDELLDAAGSIEYVMKAMRERFELVKSIFKQQRLDPKQQFATFAHGMFQYINDPAGLWAPETVKSAEYPDYPYDDNLERQGVKLQDILINYPVDQEELDIDSYAPSSSLEDPGTFYTTLPETAQLANVLGSWNGFMYRNVAPTLPCRGMLSMTLRLLSVEGQTLHFQASSRSGYGDFTVSGQCVRDGASNSLSFIMRREFASHRPPQYWNGQMDVATESITGTWGTNPDESTHFGTFILKRTAPEDLRFRPAPAKIIANRARSLWLFATSAVLSRVRRQLWSWSYFKERRDNRRNFVKLYIRNGHFGRPLDRQELTEFRRVRQTLTSADSRFYHSLANDQVRKTTSHGVRCNNCHGAIGGTRIICLVCQAKNTWDTVDLCDESGCVGASIERQNLPRPHLPTHEVVKVRRVVHLRQFGKLYRDAIEALEHARVILDTGGSPPDLEAEYDSDYSSQAVETVPRRKSTKNSERCHYCVICSNTIALPCWYYIHREVDTFICDKCEALQETKAYSHKESHDLVRCQLSTPDSDVVLSKKERLNILEERFHNVENQLRHLDSKVDDRLGTIQELLNSMLENKNGEV